MILCVKGILTAKCGAWSRCLSSGVNCIYYGLKSSIFAEVDDLRITVNYHEFACGQKVVRCVSMA
jgi:hypothetical protein